MLRAIINALLVYRARAWLVTDSTGTKYRGIGAYGTTWTDNVPQALWFARREDADAFCAEDEDAWGVIAMWNAFHVIPATLTPLQRDPSYSRLWNSLRLFRDFVLMNCTQYQMGAGSHGHPIWEHVAKQLGHTPEPQGADYRFIYPTNRLPLEELQQQELDGWINDNPQTTVLFSSTEQDGPQSPPHS